MLCESNHQYSERLEPWPACRQAEICNGSLYTPTLSPEAVASSLQCDWADTEEFLDFPCTCTDTSKATGVNTDIRV